MSDSTDKLVRYICKCYQNYVNMGYDEETAIKQTINNYKDFKEHLIY